VVHAALQPAQHGLTRRRATHLSACCRCGNVDRSSVDEEETEKHFQNDIAHVWRILQSGDGDVAIFAADIVVGAALDPIREVQCFTIWALVREAAQND